MPAGWICTLQWCATEKVGILTMRLKWLSTKQGVPNKIASFIILLFEKLRLAEICESQKTQEKQMNTPCVDKSSSPLGEVTDCAEGGVWLPSVFPL